MHPSSPHLQFYQLSTKMCCLGFGFGLNIAASIGGGLLGSGGFGCGVGRRRIVPACGPGPNVAPAVQCRPQVAPCGNFGNY